MTGNDSAQVKQSTVSEKQTPQEIDKIEMMDRPSFGSGSGLSDDWYKELVTKFVTTLKQNKKAGKREDQDNG